MINEDIKSHQNTVHDAKLSPWIPENWNPSTASCYYDSTSTAYTVELKQARSSRRLEAKEKTFNGVAHVE